MRYAPLMTCDYEAAGIGSGNCSSGIRSLASSGLKKSARRDSLAGSCRLGLPRPSREPTTTPVHEILFYRNGIPGLPVLTIGPSLTPSALISLTVTKPVL